MNRNTMINLTIALALVAGVIGFLLFPSRGGFSPRDVLAQRIVGQCSREESHEKCYEREVPKLFPSRSIPKLFELVREIRRLDPSYQFCHVLAHELGEIVVAEDPARWLDAIALNPSDNLCSNGFVHGVIVGRFRNDTLDNATLEKTIPDFARACEPREDWSPSALDQAICYHGMGHLFMFITNADVRRSLDVCQRITQSPTGDFSRVCREGVFMQIYQPLEPDDFALVDLLPEKPTANNYRRLCSVYTDPAVQGACLREAWPLVREGVVSGTGVAQFCSGQPNAKEVDACYDSATAIIGRMHLSEPNKGAQACAELPAARQEVCYTSAAQALIEEDRGHGKDALALCARAKGSVAEGCMKLLASRSRFFFADFRERLQFCTLFDERYRDLCAQ